MQNIFLYAKVYSYQDCVETRKRDKEKTVLEKGKEKKQEKRK